MSNVDYVTFWLNLYFYLIKTQQIILQLYLIYFNDCIISVKITFIYCINPIFQVSAPGGVLGYKCDGGGGGGRVRCNFLGLKFSTPVFFWVEDLTVYFFGSEKSARIFLGSNFCQANSCYAIQAYKIRKHDSNNLHVAGSKISSLVFFWVHNVSSMYFFGCKILGSVGPPCRVYTRVPPWGQCPV